MRKFASITKEGIQEMRTMMKTPRMGVVVTRTRVKVGPEIVFMRSVCVGQLSAPVSLPWFSMAIGL